MVEVDFATMGAVAGIVIAAVTAAFGFGKLVQKINYLEKRVDKLEKDKEKNEKD